MPRKLFWGLWMTVWPALVLIPPLVTAQAPEVAEEACSLQDGFADVAPVLADSTREGERVTRQGETRATRRPLCRGHGEVSLATTRRCGGAGTGRTVACVRGGSA